MDNCVGHLLYLKCMLINAKLHLLRCYILYPPDCHQSLSIHCVSKRETMREDDQKPGKTILLSALIFQLFTVT